MNQPGGSYPVLIGPGALRQLDSLLRQTFPGARIAVISDSGVAALQPNPVPGSTRLTFAPGERFKSRETWGGLSDQLLTARFGRDTVIVAFGGGVTTDLAGFVAATFLRGVPWMAVPTTTLGMIDAAVGGKTGVDTPAGKNLIGAFHPPAGVVMDTDTLATLPARSFREGLAEAVKHAVTLDAEYGDWLLNHAAAIHARSADALVHLVRRSVELKAAVVEDDALEHDRRVVLNAGHTIAHALERVSDYAMPHGEAVAAGLVLETRVGEAMGHTAPGTSEQIARLLAAMELPHRVPDGISVNAVMTAMEFDKKNRAGVVRAALASRFGEVVAFDGGWTVPLDLDVVKSLLSSTTGQR